MPKNSTKNVQTPLKKALARWESDGGAGPPNHAYALVMGNPKPSDAEYEHLHSRVIALENVIIALLAEASERQIELVREMAVFITPREDAVQHPLTVNAASQMNHVVDRAEHFRKLFSS